MYYTYVLLLDKNRTMYFGYTSNLTQRFEQHQKGLVKSTKSKLPAKLIYYEVCRDQADALQRERYFKTYRGRQFLQKRLKSYFTGLNKQTTKEN